MATRNEKDDWINEYGWPENKFRKAVFTLVSVVALYWVIRLVFGA